jgi:hypothetical protein
VFWYKISPFVPVDVNARSSSGGNDEDWLGFAEHNALQMKRRLDLRQKVLQYHASLVEKGEDIVIILSNQTTPFFQQYNSHRTQKTRSGFGAG